VPASLDDITSLAVFARVVEARSFTGAARAMGLSKSAVSARVARLEQRLAVRLLGAPRDVSRSPRQGSSSTTRLRSS
jgi:DNA-binding transcriptional LysR family regulator